MVSPSAECPLGIAYRTGMDHIGRFGTFGPLYAGMESRPGYNMLVGRSGGPGMRPPDRPPSACRTRCRGWIQFA